MSRVQVTSLPIFLHGQVGSFQPLAVDALCVSDGHSAVQPWVLVPEDVTAKVRRHGVV